MPATSEQLWDAIYRLGTDDAVEDLTVDVIAKLVECRMAEIAGDELRLTPYGEKCFVVMESGDGVVPELNELAAIEERPAG